MAQVIAFLSAPTRGMISSFACRARGKWMAARSHARRRGLVRACPPSRARARTSPRGLGACDEKLVPAWGRRGWARGVMTLYRASSPTPIFLIFFPTSTFSPSSVIHPDKISRRKQGRQGIFLLSVSADEHGIADDIIALVATDGDVKHHPSAVECIWFDIHRRDP